MRPLVIYHAGCYDGFCAAWCFWLFNHDMEFIPAQHGSKPPDVTDRVVYVVDFSYPREEMIRVIQSAKFTTVLDHHKSAEESLGDLQQQFPDKCRIVFDMNFSGGMLSWMYLFDEPSKRPWIVDYTQDRDLWRHALPESLAINAWLRSHPMDFEAWCRFTQMPISKVAGEGQAILRQQSVVVDLHVKKAYEQHIAGHLVPVVNATMYASEIAGELAKGKPFAAVYFCQQNQRVWSLRSDPNGLDVSEVARQFGGGGHEHAAGFQEPYKG